MEVDTAHFSRPAKSSDPFFTKEVKGVNDIVARDDKFVACFHWSKNRSPALENLEGGQELTEGD